MGDEALAKRLRGIRPARKASRPASIAFFMAEAISTGCLAPAIAVFMILMALSSGLYHVMFSAVWAELYGVKNLGAIRALAQAAMVFSSGVAPAASAFSTRGRLTSRARNGASASSSILLGAAAE